MDRNEYINATSGTFENLLSCNGDTNINDLNAKSATFSRNINCVGLHSSNGVSAIGTSVFDNLTTNNASVTNLINTGNTHLYENLLVDGKTVLVGTLKLPSYSNSEMQSLQGSSKGMLIYNTTYDALFVYQGIEWEQIAGSTTDEILTASGFVSTGQIVGSNGLLIKAGKTQIRELEAINITNTGVLNVTGSSNLGPVYAETIHVTNLLNDGNEIIKGKLNVNEKFTVDDGDVHIDGNVTISKYVVLGNTSVASLSVDGDSDLNSVSVTNLSNSGHESISGDLNVNGTTILDDVSATKLNITSLTNSGDSAFQNNVTIDGMTNAQNIKCANIICNSINSNSDVNIAGHVNINDKFSVDSNNGNTNIAGSLDVIGTSSLDNVRLNVLNCESANVSGGLNVLDKTILQDADCQNITSATIKNTGNQAIGGTLHVSGTSTLNNVNAGATTLTSLIDVGNAIINGTLNSGAMTCSNMACIGNSNINGTLTIGDKFIVDNGNTTIDGKLTVSDIIKSNSLISEIITTTKIINTGTLTNAGDFTVNSNKFNVNATTGNTSIAGNLTIDGDIYIHGSTITSNSVETQYDHIVITQDPTNNKSAGLSFIQLSDASGPVINVINSNFTKILEIDDKCNVNINEQFKIDNQTGNTKIAGLLDVNSIVTNSLVNQGDNLIDGNMKIIGRTDLKGVLSLPQYQSNQMNALINPANGMIIYNTTTNSIYVYQNGSWKSITNDIHATSAIFSDSINANKITIANGLVVSNGKSSFRDIGASNIYNSGDQSITGNLIINSNKFTVDGKTGDVNISGNLNLFGSCSMKTINMTELATTSILNSGDQTIDGSLNVHGKTLLNDLTTNTLQTSNLINSGNTTINGLLNVAGETNLRTLNSGATNVTSLINSGIAAIRGSLSINTNKFNVIASSGNTNIAGTLNVVGKTTLGSLITGIANVTSLINTGNEIINGSLNVNNKFSVDSATGNTTISGSINAKNIMINDLESDTINSTKHINCNTISYNSTAPQLGSIIDLSGSSTSIIVPKGTEQEKPIGIEGMIRYNTDTRSFEGFSSDSWGSLANGAVLRLPITTNDNMLSMSGFESGCIWLNQIDHNLYINSITGLKTIPMTSSTLSGNKILNTDILLSNTSNMIKQPNMPHDDITVYYNGQLDEMIMISQTNYLAEYYEINVIKNSVGDYTFSFLPKNAGSRTFDNAIMYSFVLDHNSAFVVPKITVSGGLMTRIVTYSNETETDSSGYYSFKIKNANPNNTV